MYTDCIDGRKSFNGLTGIIRSELQLDPASDDVYIFVSRSRQSIKLLFWEHGGFVIYYKKMDNGGFEVPPLRADRQGWHISGIQLLQVIRGIEFQKKKAAQQYAENCTGFGAIMEEIFIENLQKKV